MASQIERVTAELRRRILLGELAPGDRIVELQYAPELGVSRTPLRLALGELERQGLLERVGKRGFQVRRVTLDEVAQAIDVRGVLEGLAVRSVAEAGLGETLQAALADCVAEGRALLQAAAAPRASLDTVRWAAMNGRFHQLLLQAADNAVLTSTLQHVFKSPLADPGALGFNGALPVLELSFVERAQADHEDILQAIVQREGSRAEALMREHARRSRDNKRTLMAPRPPPQTPPAPAEPPAPHPVRRPRKPLA